MPPCRACPRDSCRAPLVLPSAKPPERRLSATVTTRLAGVASGLLDQRQSARCRYRERVTLADMVTKNRLEAFSDGVFAIVITLLVIEIRPPELGRGETLAHGLWHQWPNYLGYFLSFVILGVMWLNHHRIFEPVSRIDG